MTAKPLTLSIRQHDFLLFAIMGMLAACGLVYQYLLAHYSGRILGAVEQVIFAMIGIMIVSMGLGAFAARVFKSYFSAFVWLEVSIAFIGVSAVLILAATTALANILPQILMQTFLLPPDLIPSGGMIAWAHNIAAIMPYVAGFVLGFLLGMEIPLIARIREQIHGQHLANNLGTIYGADYIGAGIGAAIWVIFLLSIDISKAAALTASLNLVAGAFFILRYWHKLHWRKTFVSLHLVLALIIILMFNYGNQWLRQMSNLLYLDKVVHSQQTRYQQLIFTERNMGLSSGSAQKSIINFYINGRLQFSSIDEHIYHDYLVAPVLAGSARHDNILIIGGGDGLALRDVLKYDPKKVTLIDLDSELIDVFQIPEQHLGDNLAQKISYLNQNSLQDKRVNILRSDAFIAINELLKSGQVFDAIIVDLPDPSHPDLNKLYTVNFYARLKQLLSGDGLIAIQSTSPYHAKNSFISIGKTLSAANFIHVQQYHDNVPSFGEWGWTIAAKMGASPLSRLNNLDKLPVQHTWLNLKLLKAAFIFPNDFYHDKENIGINTLGSHTLYQLHQKAWQDQQGIE